MSCNQIILITTLFLILFLLKKFILDKIIYKTKKGSVYTEPFGD